VKTETGQYQLLRNGPGPGGGSQVVISNNPALQNVPVAQHQQVQGGQQQQPMHFTTSVMVNQTGTAYRFQGAAAATTTFNTTSVNSAPVGNTPTTTASNTNTGTYRQVLKLIYKFNFLSISEIIIEIKEPDVRCQSQMQKFSIRFTAASCE